MTQSATHRRALKRSLRIAIGTVTALAIVSAPLVSEVSAGAAPNPASLTPADINRRDAPALNFVDVTTKGTVTLYLPQLTSAAISYIQGDPTGQVDSLLAQVAKNPQTYLSKGQKLKELPAEGGGYGSAWNVSSDGYLVTNAHVAADVPADLVNVVAEQPASAAPLAQATDTLFNQLSRARPRLFLTSAQQKVLQQIVSDFLVGSASVTNYTKSIRVYPDMTRVSGEAGMEATVVSAGEGYPGKDVAILKIAAKNIPAIALDDDSQLASGDSVFALGYPFDATFDTDTIKTTTISSTISTGTVSNRLQSSAADYRFIQHTASTNHGSSGGVLVNGRGRAVGITTAGDSSLAKNGTNNGGQFYFAVPSSVIREFLDKANVTPTRSSDQDRYDKAADLLASGSAADRSKAKTLLAKVEADGYATPHLAELVKQTGAAPGLRPASGGVPVGLLVGGGMVALLIVSALVLVSRRRRATPTHGGMSVPAPPAPVGNSPWSPTTPNPPTPYAPTSPTAGFPTTSPTAPAPAPQPWYQAPQPQPLAPQSPPPAPPAPQSWPPAPPAPAPGSAAQPWFQAPPAPPSANNSLATATVAPTATPPAANTSWWTQGGYGGNGQ